MTLSEAEKTQLIEAARSMVEKAYAPYSGFRVGAALMTIQGNIFTGCNVENSSYGITLCAERAAIAMAVATEGGENLQIRALAVVNEADSFCSPCGACRQAIFEFGSDALILFQGVQGWQEKLAKELLPEGFSLNCSQDKKSN